MSDLFQCLDAIPEYRRAALQDALVAEWTCASAGLEGNTFSLGDTDFFLREGLTVAGKSFREHCEIKGHADALKWMEHLVITNTPLSQEHLFTLHRFIQTETVIDAYAPVGAFKNAPNGRTAETMREKPSGWSMPLLKMCLRLWPVGYTSSTNRK